MEIANPNQRPHRKRRTKVMVPPVAAADGVATVAARHYLRDALSGRGPATQARRLVAAGHPVQSAAKQAAELGKGYLAEIELASSVSARSGLVGSPVRARPNSDSFHQTDDIILTEAGVRVGAVQVKNGKPAYIQREIESGKYTAVVANREAVERLEQVGALKKGQVPSCINHSGIQSTQLTATSTRTGAADVLTATLEGPTWRDHVVPVLVAAKAGATDGAITLGLSLVAQIIEDVVAGRRPDFGSMLGEALKSGTKAFIRTGAVTYSQALTLLRRAKNAFSARLIHAITSSTMVMSAMADVVVEFAFDLVGVIRGEMDEDTLLRNLGMNMCGGLGSLAGVGIALVAAKGAPWWLLLLAMTIGLWVGREAGRQIGGRIFGEANTEPEGA